MEGRAGWYDPEVLLALEKVIGFEKDFQVREVTVSELKAHTIHDQDLQSTKGQFLISKRHELNAAVLKRLKHFCQNSRVQEPIRV